MIVQVAEDDRAIDFDVRVVEEGPHLARSADVARGRPCCVSGVLGLLAAVSAAVAG